MADQLFRVGGSGYTAFSYAGQPFLYCKQVRDQAPQPVTQPVPIQPIDEVHPIEVALPRAHGMGTLVVSVFEQWLSDVWDQLPGFAGAVDIIEVFDRNIRNGSVTVTKVITSPTGAVRSVHYHNTIITNIDEGETIMLGTMELAKDITLQYTHRTRT